MLGGFSSDSLIAPLDMLRFGLAYTAILVVPGFALATLFRPLTPRAERIALAIPCGLSMVAIIGLITALLHLPFTLESYAVLAGPATLGGAVTAWRRRREPLPDSGGLWLLAPAGVAVIQLVAICAIYAGAVVPSGSDAVSHVQWAALIARAHIFPIALLSSSIGTNDGGFYPPAFHAAMALVLGAAPMPVYHAVFYGVLAAIAMLPLALFSYVRMATGSARLGGLAALAALAFEPLPFFVLAQGLYTLIVVMPFVPGLAIVLRDALGHGRRGSVALAMVMGIGLFYTHPTEFVTAGLLALVIVPGLLRSARAWASALAQGILIAGAWLAAAFPALRGVRAVIVGAGTEINVTHDFTRPGQVQLGPVLNAYVQWVYGHNLSFLLLIAVAGGVAWCVVKRQHVGLVVVQMVLMALFIDANSYNVLHPLYVLSFPWALWERMAATHYWFALPLAAISIDKAIKVTASLAAAKSPAYATIAASPIVILGMFFPIGMATARTANYANARKVIAAPDLGAVRWLATHAPTHAVVVNDEDMSQVSTFDAPIDAGLWMPALGAPTPLFWRSGSGPGSFDDRLYLLQHVADVPLPPRAARYIARYKVRYVFYGGGIRQGVARHLDLRRLIDDPLLRLQYTSAATCNRSEAPQTEDCPPTASYIFGVLPMPSAATDRSRHGATR